MIGWRRERRHRRWLQWTWRALALAVVLVLAWAFLIEPARLVQRDYVLQPRGWPAQCDGLRLDVAADLHVGSPRNGLAHLDQVVRALRRSDAKAVLLAGDYVILSVFLGHYVPPAAVAAHLRPLTAVKPVYAVLGNHDWWKNGPQVRKALQDAGVTMLDDRAQPVAFGRCRFWIVGLGDLQQGHPDVRGTFAQVTDAAPVLALTHEPDLFPRIPARAALTIAGHTHGGQVDPWPFGRTAAHPYVPGSPWAKGVLVDGDRLLFVSPGIGTSIAPLRLGVPPEISRLTLRAGPAATAAGRAP